MTSRQFAFAAVVPGLLALALVLFLRAELAYPGMSFIGQISAGGVFSVLNVSALIALSLALALSLAGSARRLGASTSQSLILAGVSLVIFLKSALSGGTGLVFLPLWYVYALPGPSGIWMLASGAGLACFFAHCARKLPESRLFALAGAASMLVSLRLSFRLLREPDLYLAGTYYELAPLVAACAIALPCLWAIASDAKLPVWANISFPFMFLGLGSTNAAIYASVGQMGIPRDYFDYPEVFAGHQFAASVSSATLGALSLALILLCVLNPPTPADTSEVFT